MAYSTATPRHGSRVGAGGEGSLVPSLALPPPPRHSSPSSCASTVGALVTKTVVSAAASTGGAGECRSQQSLLSRLLHRRGCRIGGFGCRLRLPRYCSAGASNGDAKEDTPIAPKVVRKTELGIKKPAEELSRSLGLGASLVFLISKGVTELSRMAELRSQMERLLIETKTEVRQDNSAPSFRHSDGGATAGIEDTIVRAGEDALSDCSRTAGRTTAYRGGGGAVLMDRMEAELQAELERLQSNDENCTTPLHDCRIENEPKSDVSGSPSEICTDDGGVKDGDIIRGDDDYEEEEEEEEEERLQYGGVSARELERRLHELLQARQEERIAELESALECAERKLDEKEREVCWWRDTAKLVTQHKDESRLR